LVLVRLLEHLFVVQRLVAFLGMLLTLFVLPRTSIGSKLVLLHILDELYIIADGGVLLAVTSYLKDGTAKRAPFLLCLVVCPLKFLLLRRLYYK
jgi:hypothetical protein